MRTRLLALADALLDPGQIDRLVKQLAQQYEATRAAALDGQTTRLELAQALQREATLADKLMLADHRQSAEALRDLMRTNARLKAELDSYRKRYGT